METTIVVTIIIAVAGLLAHVVKQILDRRADLRVRKIPIYTELLEAIQAALRMQRTKEAVSFKAEVTSRVVTWGSSEVVVAYALLRDRLMSQDPNVPEIKQYLGEVLAGIRNDLGHADRQAPERFAEVTAILFFEDLPPNNGMQRTRD